MSSKQPSTTTTVNEGPAWARGYQYDLMSKTIDVADNPYTSRVAGFSNDQTSAMDQIRAAANDPGMAAYNQSVGNNLRQYAAGDYLDVTKAPGFQNALDRVQQAYSTGIAPQTAAAFYNGGAGPAGENSAYRETMGYNNRGFADSLQKLIGDQYNTQQGFQMNAMSALPQYMQAQGIMPNMLNQIGQQQQGLEQARLEDIYNYPREQLDFYGNNLSRAIGGSGMTTAPNPNRGSKGAGILGGAMAGAGIGAMVGGPAAPMTALYGAGIGALGGALT
jgi:hypothetical protein